VLLVPVVGVIYPLLRFSPAIYSWLQHRRIYKLYSELMVLEAEMASAPVDHTKNYVQRLDQLEERASHLSLPMAFQPLLYALRLHVGVVRQRIEKSPGQVPEMRREP
jgi:hypothetical protein